MNGQLYHTASNKGVTNMYEIYLVQVLLASNDREQLLQGDECIEPSPARQRIFDHDSPRSHLELRCIAAMH